MSGHACISAAILPVALSKTEPSNNAKLVLRLLLCAPENRRYFVGRLQVAWALFYCILFSCRITFGTVGVSWMEVLEAH